MTEEHPIEVAFSFLSEDEDLAVQVEERVQDRLATFLHTKWQDQLVGTDGEKRFDEVFGREARIVVILYRDGWGQTPWTRIEETAIRNRALHEGYGFLLVIPVEVPPRVPDWLPRTQIWFDLDRSGVAGAAAVIEARVQDSGGAVKPETSLDRAVRSQRKRDLDDRRKASRDSQGAVNTAREGLSALFDTLEMWATQISQVFQGLELQCQRGEREMVVSGEGYSVSIHWLHQWANTLGHSSLFVQTWRGILTLRDRFIWEEPERLDREEFDFSLDRRGNAGWHARGGCQSQFLSSARLGEYAVKKLLALIDRS
jgi:hypothetical protein